MKDNPRAGAWTPEQVKAARLALGLTQDELGARLRIADGRVVRRWEKGEREISGPAEVALELLLEKHRARGEAD